ECRGLLLQRLVTLARSPVKLFLEVGGGYVCGWCFASLSAPTFYRLSASTASLHVTPGRFTTILNPRQIQVSAPCWIGDQGHPPMKRKRPIINRALPDAGYQPVRHAGRIVGITGQITLQHPIFYDGAPTQAGRTQLGRSGAGR